MNVCSLEVGRYHVVDFGRNMITAVNFDPEEMARELGVLEDYEEMVEDEDPRVWHWFQCERAGGARLPP